MEFNEIKNLTTPGKPHSFKLGDDRFDCAAKLPAGVIRDFGKMRRLFTDAQAVTDNDDRQAELIEQANEMFFGLLDIVLLPESAERFAVRMRDPLNPIDMTDVSNVIQWIVVEYGGRPTQPPNGSSPSVKPSDNSSTENLPPTVVAI